MWCAGEPWTERTRPYQPAASVLPHIILSQSFSSAKDGNSKARRQHTPIDKHHTAGLGTSLGFGPLCFETSEPGSTDTYTTMGFQSPSKPPSPSTPIPFNVPPSLKASGACSCHQHEGKTAGGFSLWALGLPKLRFLFAVVSICEVWDLERGVLTHPHNTRRRASASPRPRSLAMLLKDS